MSFGKYLGKFAASGFAVAAVTALGLMSASTASASVSVPGAFISKVVFAGVSAGNGSPLVNVQGSNFGRRPAGNMVTACQGKYMGYSFGTAFYFWDNTVGWRAGQPSDCIGIYIRQWTEHDIKFTFGSAYGTQPGYTLYSFDSYSLTIKGYTFNGIINGRS